MRLFETIQEHRGDVVAIQRLSNGPVHGVVLNARPEGVELVSLHDGEMLMWVPMDDIEYIVFRRFKIEA